MEYKLRNYQEKAVTVCTQFFKNSKTVPSLAVLPTAWGKSWLIAHIVNNLPDPKFLVLVPSKELLEQNLSKLRLLGGDASVYSASIGKKEVGHITYATIGSIKNIGHMFKGYKMIVDEADRYPKGSSGMFRTFIKAAGITHVLGLTATPFKLETLGGMYDNYSVLRMLTSRSKKGVFFKEILHVCQIQEMIAENYWPPIIYETYDFETDSLIYNSTRAEYTDESMREAYITQGIEDKIIEYVEKSDRKSILVFVPFVSDAITLASRIPGAEAIYGDMDKSERERVIKGFKDLSIRVVVNVNVLSVGFDHPELDCIISGRMTASLSWWYQAAARGTRIHPNKKDLLIVDFAGNTAKFGRLEELEYVKEASGWKLYGEDGCLLTGVPITEIGEHTKETEFQKEEEKVELYASRKKEEDQGIISFGKFKGKKVEETPQWWRDWMLANFEFKKDTMYIKDKIYELR